MNTPATLDFRVARISQGIFMLDALTPAAREWEEEYIAAEAMRFGTGVIVEGRYLHAVLEGISDAGLTVEGEGL